MVNTRPDPGQTLAKYCKKTVRYGKQMVEHGHIGQHVQHVVEQWSTIEIVKNNRTRAAIVNLWSNTVENWSKMNQRGKTRVEKPNRVKNKVER